MENGYLKNMPLQTYNNGHTKEETGETANNLRPTAQINDAGVLLIALGHPYYGEMAANLAASIRFTAPTVPIHLIWEGKSLDHLDDAKKRLFTSMAEAPAESFTKNGKKAYFKAKTWMYRFSPFKKTLFLDVDMMWFSKTNMVNFLSQMNGIEFTIQNRDRIDLAPIQAPENYLGENKKKLPFYLWANIAEMKKEYGFEKGFIYGLHSELVYFEKSDKIAELFKTIEEIYNEPKMKPFLFAGDMADELAFAIAMVLHGIEPHRHPFSPVYWWKLAGKNGVPPKIAKLAEKFVAYSVGGNVQPQIMQTTYNIMAKAYARNVGVNRVWTLKNKRSFIHERKVL